MLGKTRSYLQERISRMWPTGLDSEDFFHSDAFKNFLTCLARNLAARQDLFVEYSNSTATDNNRIYIDPKIVKNEKDIIIRTICIIGGLCHEICHLLFTSWNTIELMNNEFQNKRDLKRMHFLFNLIEDAAIERNGKKKYRGLFRLSIRVLNSHLFKEMKPLNDKMDSFQILIDACMMHCICRQSKGEINNAEIKAVVQKAIPILDRGRLGKTSLERYQAAKDLYQILLPYFHDEHINDYIKNSKIGTCGKGNEPEGNNMPDLDTGSSNEINNSKNGSTNSKRVKPKNTGSKGKNEQDLTAIFKPFEKALIEYRLEQNQDTKEKKTNEGKLENTEYNNFKGHSHITIVNQQNWYQRPLWNIDSMSNEMRITIHDFIRRLKDILKYNTDMKITGLYEGKLDKKHLYRNETDKKIFYKNRYKSDEAELAIMLLVDMSGSMRGGRIRQAVYASLMMFKACSALKIPIAIVGHQAVFKCNRVLHYWFVNFDKNKSERNLAYMEADGNTREGLSIRCLAKQFSKRKEKDKIMLCISDGAPVHFSAGDSYVGERAQEDSAEAVKFAKKLGIKVIGIAIGENKSEIKKIYRNYVDVPNIKNLPFVLINILKKSLLK